MMKRIKMLIVEDEIVAAMELKSEAEKLNCVVTEIVYTKKKVFNAIQKDEPDIILMDIKLGKNQDGIDLVKEIQERKSIPVVYITAYSDEDTMQRAFSTNPIGYIVKPFKPEELKTNIQLAIYKLSMVPPKEINPDYHYLGDGFYFDLVENNLSILINANYNIVQNGVLEEAIWDGNVPSQSALRTLVYRLKGKFGNNIIEAIYGYGYRLKLHYKDISTISLS